MQQNKALVYTLAMLAVVFWGVSYIWSKVVFEYYGPVTVMTIRLSLASVLVYGINRMRRLQQKIHRSDYRDFFILSFFSPFLYFIGENFGLFHVSPTVAAVVIATIPVFTPFLGLFVFREKLSWLNLAGFAVGFSGIWIMVLDHEFRFSASPLGLGLLFFAVASALVNIIYLKRLAQRYNSFTIIAVQNLIGALLFLPLFLIFDLPDFLQIRPGTQAIASLLALAVFGSTLAFMFYTTAVRQIGVARTSIFSNLIPVITALSAWLVLGERIDLSKILGMTVVITGLLMTQAPSLGKLLRRSEKQGQSKKIQSWGK